MAPGLERTSGFLHIARLFNISRAYAKQRLRPSRINDRTDALPNIRSGDHYKLNIREGKKFMSTRNWNHLLLGGLLATAVGVTTAATAAAPAGVASGNVSGWVKSAKLVGPASAATSVTIAVHLSLKNTADMKTLVAEVSSPDSKNYGRYLTPSEFASRFAADAASVNAVRSLLEKAGMTHVTVGPLGAYVSATASVSQLRTAFHISQNLYTYKGLTLRANSEEPTIPSALAGKILFIEGLDDTGLLRTPQHHSETMGKLVAPATAGVAADKVALDATPSAVTPPPMAAGKPSPYCNTSFGPSALVANLSTAADVYGAAIPWLGCGYSPQQIQAAYGFNHVAETGKGVTVAIVDAYASPTLLADGNRYAAKHGLPKLVEGENFSQKIPAGIYGVSPSDTCGPYGWWTEQSLDLAAVHGTATGAKILYVGSEDCGTSLDLALQNVLYEHLADVVTNSYGYLGEAIATGQAAADDQAYMAGALQGITILFSSGDDGDQSQNLGVASGGWPATSAYVTGVGGTTLLLKNPDGEKAEYGWGTYRAAGVGHHAEFGERLYRTAAECPARQSRRGDACGPLYRLSVWRDILHRRQCHRRFWVHGDFQDARVLRERHRRHEPCLTPHGRCHRRHGREACE